MNRWMITAALTLVLGTSLAMAMPLRAEADAAPGATGTDPGCHGAASGDVAVLPPEAPWVSLALNFAEQIGLEDYQRTALEKLRTEFASAAASQGEQIEKAERELGHLLSQPVPDMSAARATLDRLGVLHTELRLTRIETLVDARNVLTEAQRTSLARTVAEAHGSGSGHMMRGAAEPTGVPSGRMM